jgi:hypothetical protein
MGPEWDSAHAPQGRRGVKITHPAPDAFNLGENSGLDLSLFELIYLFWI